MSDTTEGDAKQDMGIDPYEKNWMRASVLLLVAFAATISVAGLTMGFEVPGDDEQLDPRTFRESAPWDEPGLREISPGVYEAYIVAQMFAYEPARIEVPVGSEVTFHLTSADVQHGFKITDTNVNMQVVPGRVSTLTHTFDEVGEFPAICHEYCGLGHASMFGAVNVVADLPAPEDQQ